MDKSALIEAELDGIAAILEANGYEVLFGYKDGCRHTAFYNSGQSDPVHSLAFDPQSCDGGTWELVGGFVAYPFVALDDKGGTVSDYGRAEHLFGGEVCWYDPSAPEKSCYLGIARSHYADGCLLNEYAAGGFGNPLVIKAIEGEYDRLGK